MSPPQQLRQRTSNCSSLLIYRPRKDERLSWPSWLTYSGWFAYISGHPSATGRAQDSESTPAKDRCSTAGPHNQPYRAWRLRLIRLWHWFYTTVWTLMDVVQIAVKCTDFNVELCNYSEFLVQKRTSRFNFAAHKVLLLTTIP